MNTLPKTKLRSRIDLKRYRMDNLEHNVSSIITQLQHLQKVSPSRLSMYHRYLAWCVKILSQLKQGTISVFEDYDHIELLVDTYKHELMYISKNPNLNYIAEPINLLKQPTTGYGTFLQTSITIYLKYIDLYQMWFTPEEVNALLTKNTSEMSSYVFLALLAYFTASNNSILAQQIYRINIKKAKKKLAEAYANPSFNNVIGLLFMSFISGYKSDSVMGLRYFGSAVRMAQLLRYDKIAEEGVEEDKRMLGYNKSIDESFMEGMGEKERKIKVWSSLSMVYYHFLTLFPNMPNLSFNFKPVEIKLPKVDVGLQLGGTSVINGLEMKTTFSNSRLEKIYGEKVVTESFIEIVAHIQKVKSKYLRLNKLNEVPHQELQLPKEKFNTVLTNLTSQLIYNPSLSDGVKKIQLKEQMQNMKIIQKIYESDVFSYHLNAFINIILIYLYYPSVLVVPKPKQFSINEARLLFKSAQSVTEFYLIAKQNNIQQTYGLNRGAFACARCALATNDGFQFNYEAPYYASIMYVIYVYLSFISEEEWLLSQGFGKKIVIEAKAYVLKLLKLLKGACNSELKNEKFDSVSTVKSIKENLGNYEIEDTLLMTIKDIIM